MKICNLKVENFLAITKADLSLADRGLVLIEGINSADTSAKSNGAGKSSIADALCWCLFGTTARGESGDDVVNHTVGKNCIVATEIIDGAMVYQITRHRKHKTGKNTLTVSSYNGMTTTNLTKGTDKLTQEVVDKIVGTSHEVFTGAIYAGQERMPDLPAMTDKNLKILIEEAAGIAALEAAYREARDDLGKAEGLSKDASQALNLAHMNFVSINTHLTNLENSNTTWHVSHDQLIKDTKERLTTVDLPAVKALRAELDALEAEKIEDQIAVVDAKIAAVGSEQDELRRLEAEVSAAGARVARAAAQHGMVYNAHQKAEKDRHAVDHKIGCPCDSCGRPLTPAELSAAQTAADTKLIAAATDLANAASDLMDAQEAQKTAQEARDAFQATMTSLSAETALRNALAGSLTKLMTLRVSVDTEMKRLKVETQRLKDMQAETSPFDAQIAKTKGELEGAQKAIETAEAKVRSAEVELTLCREVVKVFGPAGARARILDDVTPYLNDQTSKYLSILSDGNLVATWSTLTKDSKGNLKEKFSIDVTNATGGGKFGLISGGEKRKVRIATALALQDLVATRATKPIDIFIGDEIDDALDSAGLERLMVILEEKAKERGTVFVISHNDLKDFVSNVLTIEKTKTGETKITESVS